MIARNYVNMLAYKQSIRCLCDQRSVSNVKIGKRFASFVTTKLMRFIEAYESVLEKRFPSAFKVYQVFSVGTKDLIKDMYTLINLMTEVAKGKNMSDLTYNELVLYTQMPKELKRVMPTILISALPFANYVVFPLAYKYPKQLLSSHFWDIKQKTDFQLIDHRKRLYYYQPVFRQLQRKLSLVTNDYDNMQKKCRLAFDKIGSGTHPTVKEILDINQLFRDIPYGIEYLSASHMKSLCRMHGLNTFIGKRLRLFKHITAIRYMDEALVRESFNISHEQIRKACFLRGLNPLGLSNEELIAWLKQWTEITLNEGRSPSLLLHCPIFLAYNHPSNWKLIH